MADFSLFNQVAAEGSTVAETFHRVKICTRRFGKLMQLMVNGAKPCLYRASKRLIIFDLNTGKILA
jgi:hypothetical protein